MLGLLLLPIGLASTLVLPLFVGKIVDQVTVDLVSPHEGTPSLEDIANRQGEVDTRQAELRKMALLLVGVFTIGSLAMAGRSYYINLAAEVITKNIRQVVFRTMLGKRIEFFDRAKTGDLVNRLSGDVGIISTTLTESVSVGIRSLGSAVLGTGFLFYTSWELALVSSLSILPIVALTRAYGNRIKTLTTQQLEALGSSSSVAEEVLNNIRTTQAFANQDYEQNRYGKEIEEAYQVGRRMSQVRGIFMGTSNWVLSFSLLTVLGYGAHLVTLGHLSAGELTAFLLYSTNVAGSLFGISGIYTNVMRGVGASDRIFEILDADTATLKKLIKQQQHLPLPHNPSTHSAASDIPDSPTSKSTNRRDASSGGRITGDIFSATKSGGRTIEDVKGKIEFRSVQFSYPARPEQTIFNDLNLVLPAGKTVAVVGESGSGKSSLISLLCRFYEPGHGTILLDGVPLHELDLAWLRQQIAIVSQDSSVFSTSIRDNIKYGKLSATDEEVEAAARLANAHDFIMSFPLGYDTLLGTRGTAVSGGQRQRICIARAILAAPKLLLLDEATSALDTATERLVQDALDKVRLHSTTLIIAHRLSTIEQADYICVLADGRVSRFGTQAEVPLSSLTDNMWKATLPSSETAVPVPAATLPSSKATATLPSSIV
eukprot:gb/GEZN01003297.1/.p1 GENE.gb/GEZN01003297.1/~~gb/GEZN01003297.1/.p1  ORF type:complete len:697 (+),score=84.49 gb/GEZN01003297.1/:123-2093(+)